MLYIVHFSSAYRKRAHTMCVQAEDSIHIISGGLRGMHITTSLILECWNVSSGQLVSLTGSHYWKIISAQFSRP